MNSPFRRILKLAVLAFCFMIMFISCNKSDNSISISENKDPDATSDEIYGTFTDSRDQHVYKTIKIGNQIWMAENLAYLPTVNCPYNASRNKPYYFVYGYKAYTVDDAITTVNYHTYGVLYNWYSAIKSCPEGWHLPSDNEWTTLENYLIANGYNYDGTVIRNKIAKSMASTKNWIYHYNAKEGSVCYESEKNNKSGFSALPGGACNYNNSESFYVGDIAYWWSSSAINSYEVWNRQMSSV
ncbi:MAG: fibrobacter succinogenes major paralogous domain-containing protein, partial [Ignavibacteria bacterium]|nr:fibrobacter succinogenes major paralogous domain-containing protein [Ignavibacteria bacterium]